MLDIETLLVPLGSETPTGVDLRAPGDVTLATIRELRREVDDVSSPDGKAKNADWRGVVRECEKALRERSKHLDLARFLTEGLVRTEGLAGLRAGLQLTRELLSRYWESLHPGYENGSIDLEVRAASITWLGTSPEFLAAVKKVPIVNADGLPPRSWFDYEESNRVDEAAQLVERHTFEELRQAGKLTGEEWLRLVRAMPIERLQAVVGEIAAVREALQSLRTLCDEKFGRESPSLIKLAELLDDTQHYLQRFAAGETTPDADFQPGPEGSNAVPGPVASAGGPMPIQSREQAYARLREAAAYLRRIEPHSPVPLLVERAILWGNMPFEGVFRDVVKSDDVLRQVWQTLGLRNPENDSG